MTLKKSMVSTKVAHGAPLIGMVFVFVLLVPAEFDIGSLKMNLSRIYLLILMPVLVVQFFQKRFGKFYLSDWLFILYVFWMGVSMMVNNPSRLVQNVGSTGLEFIGGYFVGRMAIRSADDFEKIVKFLAIIVLSTLPLAVMEAYTSKPILIEIFNAIPGVSSYSDVQHEPRLGMWRAQVMLVHPIHYGIFCCSVFTLVFVGLNGQISFSRRWLMALAIGICTFLSLSSGAFLALILQLGLISWAFVLRYFSLRWLLLIGISSFAYVVVDILSNRSPVEVFLSYATFSSHTAYWRKQIFEWGMKNVWDNPFFGIGLNDWVRPYYMYSGSMDNFWLVNAVRYGIPGFLFLGCGYALMILRIAFTNLANNTRLLRFRQAWVITFCGLTFALCTVHIWTVVYSYLFFLFGAGSWLLVVQPEKTVKEDTSDVLASQKVKRYTRFPAGVGTGELNILRKHG